MLLNRYGFILFGEIGVEARDLLDLPDSSNAPLSSSVMIVPGETYKFYLAATQPLNSTSPNVGLVGGHNYNEYYNNIGNVEYITGSPGHYIVTFTIPANTTLREQYYRLKLYSADGWFSNRLLLNKTDYGKRSALFSYRNKRAIGPLRYDLDYLANFRNVLRLKCDVGLFTTESTIEEYQQVTTGQKVTTKAEAYQVIPVTVPYVDQIGHEGWRTLLMHKDLLVNGRAYSVKTGFQNSEGAGSLGIGSFELWDSAYSVVNRC